MEINVPIVIGSIPPKRIRSRASISEHFIQYLNSSWSNSKLVPTDKIFTEETFPDIRGQTAVIFLQNRKERQIQLADPYENYVCDKESVSSPLTNFN